MEQTEIEILRNQRERLINALRGMVDWAHHNSAVESAPITEALAVLGAITTDDGLPLTFG